MHWFSPLGPNYPWYVGVPCLLPRHHAVPCTYHHTGAIDCLFTGGSLGRCGEVSSRYGIFVNSAKSGHWVWVGPWTDHCVDAPHQVCLPSLVNVAQKLLLLADKGADWPYAYIRMNDAMAHVPLSSEGHIGIMTSYLPVKTPVVTCTTYACGSCCNSEAGWFAQMG